MDERAQIEADQIGNMIGNTLVLLIRAGQQELAQSPIRWVRVKAGIAQLADSAGIVVYQLTCERPELAGNFPTATAYYLLRKQYAVEILSRVKQIRQAVLEDFLEDAAAAEQAKVGEQCDKCEEFGVTDDGTCVYCMQAQDELHS